VLEWEWMGMGMGMIRWEWEGNGNKKVIPTYLYSRTSNWLGYPTRKHLNYCSIGGLVYSTIACTGVYRSRRMWYAYTYIPAGRNA